MSIKKWWGHTIHTTTHYWLSERLHGGEEWWDVDSVPMGTVIKGDPLCQLQTSCDPCAPSLLPGPCCSSVLSLSIGICCTCSTLSCPSFLAQLVPRSLLWFVSPAPTSCLISLFLCRSEFTIVSPFLCFSQSLLPHTTPASQALRSHLAFTLFSTFLTLCSLSSFWAYLDQLLYLGHIAC